MSSVLISCCGKSIISGEHAVLFGFPVVVMGINQKMEVKITQTDNDVVKVNSNIFGNQEFILTSNKKSKTWCEAICFLCKKLSNCGLEITIKSKILDWGFGSSGAVFSCICCGLLLLENPNLTKTELLKKTLEIYFEYQNKNNKIGSGVDIITSILGGVVYYNKNKNVISKLDAGFFENITCNAVYTGHKTQTKEAFEVVKKTSNYQDILAKIGKITDKIALSVLHNKKSDFYDLIKDNQEQLTKLGLVDKATKKILEMCKKQNLPAKISGSGLGDCVLVFGKNGKFGDYKSVEIKPDNQGLEFKFLD